MASTRDCMALPPAPEQFWAAAMALKLQLLILNLVRAGDQAGLGPTRGLRNHLKILDSTQYSHGEQFKNCEKNVAFLHIKVVHVGSAKRHAQELARGDDDKSRGPGSEKPRFQSQLLLQSHYERNSTRNCQLAISESQNFVMTNISILDYRVMVPWMLC